MGLLAPVTANADIPDGYYDSLNGLYGSSLRNAISALCADHTQISYSSGSWNVFKESDTHYVNGRLLWWDMYSDGVYDASGGNHTGLNIEHGVPKSWWGGENTNKTAYCDLFNLSPSEITANEKKSNYPMGIVGNASIFNNGLSKVGTPTNGTGGGAGYVFEPGDRYKGDMARSYFYMFATYYNAPWVASYNWMYDPSATLRLKPWAYNMMLEWSANDPVDDKETKRNDVIYKYQHNRNPFVDYPELADHIWGSKSNVPFYTDGRGGNDTPVTPPTPPTPQQGGYWYAVTSNGDLNTSDQYVIVSTENHVAMSYTVSTGGQVKYFQPCPAKPTFDGQRLSEVPDNAARIRLTASGNKWVLGVYDSNASFLGYIASAAAKSTVLTQNASDAGTAATITPYGDKTVIAYTNGSTNCGSLVYNNNNNGLRFTTYTSSLEPIRLYRFQKEEGNTNGIDAGQIEGSDEIMGIFDINGRRIDAQDTNDLAPGLYIILTSKGAVKVLK